VRSETEIAATLDASGRLDGLPFMPEMAGYCGRRFRIHRRADKTCVEGFGLRRMRGTVFLEELRCDGAAHDGCQRGCLMFWKEAGLKPVLDQNGTPSIQTQPSAADSASLRASRLPTRAGDLYVCQSTALAAATLEMAGWNPMHIVREMLHGELAPTQFVQIVARAILNKVRSLLNLHEIGGLAGSRARTRRHGVQT
jgi:hypothetical protein